MNDKVDFLEKQINSDFSNELSKRFLQYALSTITSRSLPDVRDGLKPVHRRLLYAMNLLSLQPNKSFKKSARVVGDVMGNIIHMEMQLFMMLWLEWRRNFL